MQIHMRFIFSFQIIVPFEILNKRQFSVTSHNPRLFPGIKGVTYQEIMETFAFTFLSFVAEKKIVA